MTPTPNPDRRIGETQAGPELDRLVAEQVMGWKKHSAGRHNDLWFYAPPYSGRLNFQPSRNITDAWEVVEKLRADHISIGITWTTGRYGECQVNMCRATMCEPITYTANAPTAPLAICQAALAATSHRLAGRGE